MKRKDVLICSLALGFCAGVSAEKIDFDALCQGSNKSECIAKIESVLSVLKSEIKSEIAAEAKAANIAKNPFNTNHLLLTDLKFTAQLGRTDSTSDTDDAFGNSISEEIEDETVRNVGFGYYKKPVFKHMFLKSKKFSKAERGSNEKFEKFFLDNLMFSANVSYGSTITDPKGDDNFETEDKTSYYIGLDYELKFESLIP